MVSLYLLFIFKTDRLSNKNIKRCLIKVEVVARHKAVVGLPLIITVVVVVVP